MSRFRIGSAFVELRRGLLFREHRQVPFDRIQAVDISRSVLARLTRHVPHLRADLVTGDYLDL